MDARKLRYLVTVVILCTFGGIAAFLLWYQVTEVSFAIAITLSITLLGVFATQILAQSFIDMRNEIISENLLLEIRTEIHTLVGALDTINRRRVPYSLPSEAWKSSINSGRAAYFKTEIRSHLFNVYRLLSLYNLRASEYVSSVLSGNIDAQDLEPIVEATIATAKYTNAAFKAILAINEWPDSRTLFGPECIEEFRTMAASDNLSTLMGQDWPEMQRLLDQIFQGYG